MTNAASDDRWPDVLLWLGTPCTVGERVTLDEEESRHLTRVLRRGVGDAAVLADGEGGWVDAIVTRPGGRVELEVRRVRAGAVEPDAAIELAFPLLRPSRTEWLIEKATELGVTRFVPLRLARGRPHGEKPERWRRVVRSAAMQSLRSRLPEVMPPTDLDDWICGVRDIPIKRLGAPSGELPVPSGARASALVVGPEGDLAPDEQHRLGAAGFVPTTLGARRLRAETAAIALVAAVALPATR